MSQQKSKKNTDGALADTVITVSNFYEAAKDKLQLKLIAGEAGLSNTIKEKSINRPALALTGYFKHLAHKRIQLLGAGEIAYLKDIDSTAKLQVFMRIFEAGIPCLVVSHGLKPPEILAGLANQHKIPVFSSPLKSKDLVPEAILMLEDLTAPRTTLHGTMMDIKGVGTLMRGDSGSGKSEAALALVERGHSLVADDHIHVKRLRDTELMAQSAELNRGYMECRGLGIISIPDLFGIRALRIEKRIDLVISFTAFNPKTSPLQEERTGLEEHTFDILGRPVPLIEIPMRPGRDLARIVEVAAMVHALRLAGHVPAEAFNQRLIEYMQKQQAKSEGA